ncbi:MAG: alkaline phosphatase, partial [Bacteroidales bacterium]|nr:alkaline phosphatase [Bacteroidales bacterium]
KFVFLFIGDGMGLSQVSMAEAYLSTQKGEISNEALSFTKFPVMGMSTTYSANSFITCSSAAGTALSTGFKTNNGMLGVDPQNNKLTSISFKIKESGIPVGIVSNVTIDHATPAAFYANSTNRNSYYDIAVQIPASGFDFFGGGGFAQPTGENKDKKSIYEILEEGGYTVARGLREYVSKKGAKKMALFQEAGKEGPLPYVIDKADTDLSLKHVVAAAIDHLYGVKGFFLVAEGGKIDWAGHDNDAKTNILETLDFAEAVNVAVSFARKYPNETLIIVTADHETGGMTLGRDRGYGLNLNELSPQSKSVSVDKQSKEAVKELNNKANVGWTTTSHTGTAVPVYSTGPGSRLFSGRMDNTEIPIRILKAMGIE